MVVFSLRVGEVKDLNKWLPMARRRLHGVLQLLLAFVDAGFAKLSSCRTVQQLNENLEAQLAARYPGHADDMGEGRIPRAVEAAIREALRPVANVKDAGVLHKQGSTD